METYGLYWADRLGNFTNLIGVYSSDSLARLIAYVRFPDSIEHDDFVIIGFVADSVIE